MIRALKPQDVVVLLKLAEMRDRRATYAQLSKDLFMSASEVHASIQRAKAARLLQSSDLGDRPDFRALQEFLIHGVKYAFPVQKGSITRGVPTGAAAAPLSEKLTQEDPAPVWPFEEGERRGYAFSPLHKSVARAALRDRGLYEMLALVDAIRDGRARERELAQRELSERLADRLGADRTNPEDRVERRGR
jgi:hypothetical protein